VSAVPTLSTARLRLRSHRRDDFPHCLRLWGDPEVTRYIGGRPFTAEEVWGRMLRYAGLWSLMGFGYWAVEAKDAGYVGDVGLADFHRGLEPPLDGQPELGWALLPDHHGKGLATEAVSAAIAWAGSALPHAQLACLIDPGNERSERVAQKCGFAFSHAATYKGSVVRVLTR
jgi:RimJ/RimL family protein N-acetyltransferase